MQYTITVTRADPSGNITLFVEGAVPKEAYAAVGAHLMQREELKAEQVGFITEALDPVNAGRLEMSGGEFCGNASRAFGMLLAERQGMDQATIPIEISGCVQPVRTDSDRTAGTAYAEMPLPEAITNITLPAPFGTCPLVCFGGIWHILAVGLSPETAPFSLAAETVYQQAEPEALGVMYLSPELDRMTPVVYVPASGTVFAEGSCGSGSTAVAAWLAQNGHGETVVLQQPAGSIAVQIGRENGQLRSLRMGGRIRLEAPIALTVEV